MAVGVIEYVMRNSALMVNHPLDQVTFSLSLRICVALRRGWRLNLNRHKSNWAPPIRLQSSFQNSPIHQNRVPRDTVDVIGLLWLVYRLLNLASFHLFVSCRAVIRWLLISYRSKRGN